MSFPFTLQLNGYRLPVHLLFEWLAFFAGFRYFVWLRRRQGDVLASNNRVLVILGAIFGALAGSRLLGALEQPDLWLQSANKLLFLYQSKTIVGGLLGGLAGVELIKKLMGEHRSSGDLFVFPIILGLCIGRLGCFSMGVYEQTYGLPTTWPTGMNLGDGLLRHPVALYEIGLLVLLVPALGWTRKKLPLANGALFKLFMVAYLVFRFWLDYLKPHYTYPAVQLSAIQMACVGGIIYYASFLLHPYKLLQPHYART